MVTSTVQNRTSCVAAFALTALTLAGAAQAETRHVPAQYPTIQAGINAAQNGDIVEVADGTYTGLGNRDISFLGKAITVRSANGASSCTVDVQCPPDEYQSGFAFVSGDSPAAVLEGFTIRGGRHFNGAGISISSASPSIRDCVLTANVCDCWGAAIYVQGSASPLIERCTIIDNTSNAEGGGVFIIGGVPVIRDCVISDNDAGLGGAVCTFGGTGQFINCIFAGNTAQWAGAAYMNGGSLTNCTIVGNSASSTAAALYFNSGAAATNSIIWGNAGPSVNSVPQGSITYSNVQGGFAGAGNISVDPKFETALNGDYRLTDGSPCIDAGNSAAAGLPATDMAGEARRVNDPATADSGIGGAPMVDIGAYEFQACPCDFDGGGLGVSDIFAFLSKWFSHAPEADFDGNTQIQVGDIFSYLSCWFGSCG